MQDLKIKMQMAAEKYEFEKAEIIKNKIESLSVYQSKSTIVHPSITNTDVIHLISDEKNSYAHYFKIINGAVIHAQTIEIKKKWKNLTRKFFYLQLSNLEIDLIVKVKKF